MFTMQKGIDKLTGILEKNETASFTAEEYMSQYTTIYNMCTQRAPHEYSEQLYDRYKNAFITYLSGKVRYHRVAVAANFNTLPLAVIRHRRAATPSYDVLATPGGARWYEVVTCRSIPELNSSNRARMF